MPFVHATVVLAERPTSAKPGDEAIVLSDGTIEGFVGGACAESTVRAQGLGLLDSGASLLLRICPEPEPAQEGKAVVHNPCLSGGTLEIFLEPELPAPNIAVIGDTPIARALVSLAAPLGYRTTVVAAGGDLPADAAGLVVASHGRDEEDALRDAIAADVPYIGLVASRKRGEAVLASLGLCCSMTGRVHTPAGLDLGARSPEEIALSILAEIVAERPRPSGRTVGADGPAAAEPDTAIDPVCAMSVAMVEASLHLDHEGERFWFCGSGCLRAFAAAPDSFLTTS
ncbi:MAG: XdhC family protein [Ilumatobacteraceae bacterium]